MREPLLSLNSPSGPQEGLTKPQQHPFHATVMNGGEMEMISELYLERWVWLNAKKKG